MNDSVVWRMLRRALLPRATNDPPYFGLNCQARENFCAIFMLIPGRT
jgi:hypothetical protein